MRLFYGCAPKYVRFFSGSESASVSESKGNRIESDSDTDSDPELGQYASRPCQELWSFAGIYFALGEIENGFEWLEKAIGEGDTFILFLPVDPFYDPLRSNPRYQALLRKMNLKP